MCGIQQGAEITNALAERQNFLGDGLRTAVNHAGFAHCFGIERGRIVVLIRQEGAAIFRAIKNLEQIVEIIIVGAADFVHELCSLSIAIRDKNAARHMPVCRFRRAPCTRRTFGVGRPMRLQYPLCNKIRGDRHVTVTARVFK